MPILAHQAPYAHTHNNFRCQGRWASTTGFRQLFADFHCCTHRKILAGKLVTETGYSNTAMEHSKKVVRFIKAKAIKIISGWLFSRARQ